MDMSSAPALAADARAPLDTFSRCHLGILAQLQQAAQLDELAEAAARARQTAAATIELFRLAVLPHHAEEEAELFPAVLRSALPAERAEVRQAVERLTSEHRAIETRWKELEPAVRQLARGALAEIDGEALAGLVRAYLAHARYEEEHLLPLAERILGRDGNHMAALGLALHMRHAPTVIGHI